MQMTNQFAWQMNGFPWYANAKRLYGYWLHYSNGAVYHFLIMVQPIVYPKRQTAGRQTGR